MDADIWVDTMPFHETREYVRRVMAYAVFYDQRLEQPIQRLSERMRTVSRPETLLAASLNSGP
jgi:soluble lytic murein transglycosylase